MPSDQRVIVEDEEHDPEHDEPIHASDEIVSLVKWMNDTISAVHSYNNKPALWDELDSLGDPCGMVSRFSLLLSSFYNGTYLDSEYLEPCDGSKYFEDEFDDRFPGVRALESGCAAGNMAAGHVNTPLVVDAPVPDAPDDPGPASTEASEASEDD